MKRIVFLCFAPAFAVSACQSASVGPAHNVYGMGPGQSAPAISQYDFVAPAPIWGELSLCGGRVSNSGPVSVSGQSLAYEPYISTPAGLLLRNPTDGACLSSGFGWRGVASGGGKMHTGLDLANANGGFIYAAGAARVSRVAVRGGYGLTVELDHGDGVRTLYAHLSETNPGLRPGQWIAAGKPVGRMGMTGNATGVHLHYEVWVGDQRVDPLVYGPVAGAFGPVS